MSIQPEHQKGKVRVVIECTADERAFIKMMAAKKHMTISEFFLSMAKEEMANKPKIPNKETLKAVKELDENGGYSFETLEDFWKQMRINPND